MLKNYNKIVINKKGTIVCITFILAVFLGIVGLLTRYFFLFFIGAGILVVLKHTNFFGVKDIYNDISIYSEYINENSVSLGLYARPVTDNSKIVLANKHVIIEFDIISFSQHYGKIKVTDKIKNRVCHIGLKYGLIGDIFDVFKGLCGIKNYDTKSNNIFLYIEDNCLKKYMNEKKLKTLSLDINQASEAELTALPGVTIAKAKRAIKMRKKYAFYLSVNQFYEAINLEEQFIEQITSKGTKILLNTLPEYQQLEMKRD